MRMRGGCSYLLLQCPNSEMYLRNTTDFEKKSFGNTSPKIHKKIKYGTFGDVSSNSESKKWNFAKSD